ncbi:gephyrin-like molybdotransferase receptor GlpR [Saccharomonospora sp. NPDC046836]|uniref:divisome protein SepX/GlpR n=1 Tax=Saccharomonospora sp. NPDC046836 TaxID=3156921 RepID=UPI0033D7093F
MPSSLIIVALAAAWLVVLVPMIARKRQEITQTTDSALAARVVRSGSARSEWRRESAMTGDAKAGDDLPDEDLVDSADDEDLDEDYDEPEPVRKAGADDSSGRRYRPGRGGFDPEAAEMAARAKYAFRQRVVLGLILVVVVTAVIAGFVLPIVWWANGLADATLVGYLVYLRRQVRIEEEIRQRRLARFSNANRRQARAAEPVEHIEFVTAPRREPVGSERKPVPTSRIRRQAVVVDLEDEDPAFHELDEPGRLPYRRAVGE